jgi:transcriptional regulator with XRE-family HTH domain
MELERVLAANVRRLREAQDLTQEKLAQKAGLAMRYVSGIERGEENPTVSTLAKLAKALGVHPSVLLSEQRTR